jgi:hypothetical protein
VKKVHTACEMLARAFAAGVPAERVTMDEGYGQSKSLWAWLERADGAPHVARETVWTHAPSVTNACRKPLSDCTSPVALRVGMARPSRSV